jgi:hypothetical protein
MGKIFRTKSIPFILTVAMAAVLLSCSNPNSGTAVDTDGTLRSTADAIANSTEWSPELEPDLLTGKVTGADGVETTLVAGPENIFASGNEKSYEPLYPSIPGFALLDTSSLDGATLQTLDGFCTAITTGVDADSFMAKDHLYSLVLFLYDLNQTDGPVFSSYVLGQPFKGDDDTFQCPVRFYYDSSKMPLAEQIKQVNGSSPVGDNHKSGTSLSPSLDVYLYLVQIEGSWRIDQIAYDVQQK